MRERWLDNAKAFTIFLVVFAHCITNVEGHIVLEKTVDVIYYFHMPLFFVLSGYSFYLMKRKNSSADYFVRHLMKIAGMFAVFSVLYVVINVKAKQYIAVNSEVEYGNLLTLWKHPIAHYWYLYTLFFLYLLGEFLFRIVNKNTLISRLLSYGIITLSLILSYCVQDGEVRRVLHMFFFFGLGILGTELKSNVSIIVAIIIYVLIFVETIVLSNNDVYFLLAYSIVASILAISMIKRFVNKEVRIISYLGRNCLWIYVFHSYFTAVTQAVCKRVMPESCLIRIVIATLSGMVGPLLLVELVRLIKKKLEKKNAD